VNTMGRYSLLERIGEGGMAEIYVAASHGAEGFERRFVVKRLHQHLARRKEAVSQFIDEARLQAQLVHSNIVPVFDFGRVGDEYFLALEYIHGRDLEKLLNRHIQVYNRPLDLRVVGYIIHEVLEALAYSHTKRDQTGRPLEIVHRDVSPANVMISYQGEVKLTDFGIVKAGQRVSQTELGMVKGNASFMSPEQARGVKVDARSDLFSTAVVMFCCLTGQALYKGETTLNQLVRAAVGPATQQFQAIEMLPSQSVHILSKALMLDPALRYQTAAEFARELAPFVPGMKIEVARLMAELFPETKRPTN
jgi:serine/threonine protein kinase